MSFFPGEDVRPIGGPPPARTFPVRSTDPVIIRERNLTGIGHLNHHPERRTFGLNMDTMPYDFYPARRSDRRNLRDGAISAKMKRLEKRRIERRAKYRKNSGSESDSDERSLYRRYNNLRHARFDSDHSDSDTESRSSFDQDPYSFSLLRHSRSQDGTVESPSEPSEKGTSTIVEHQDPTGGSQLWSTRQVLRSEYTGDGAIGGMQTARLTLMNEPIPNTRKKTSPMYKWMHLEDPMMNLDNFQTKILQIAGLTDGQKVGITRLFVRLRKKHDKPMQTLRGTTARFMFPCLLQENLDPENGSKASEAGAVTWMCLPYFCLDKYLETMPSSRSSHPMRTLLQARFSLTPKERDMLQAVSTLQGTPRNHCFHIAQLWSLVVSDSLVVTCTRTPISALQGDSISIAPSPTPGILEANSPMLFVSEAKFKTQLWAFPLSECKSWFAFVSHFCEYWPRKFQVVCHGKPIDPEEWPRILKRPNVRLYLDFKSTSRRPAKGILPEPVDDSLPLKAQGNVNVTVDAQKPKSQSSNASESRDQRHSSTVDPSISSAGLGSKEFHFFAWLNASRDAVGLSRDGESTAPTLSNGPRVPTGVDEQGIKADLEECDRFLSHKTSINERLKYQKCPLRTRRDVYDGLLKEKERVFNLTKDDKQLLEDYEMRVDLFNRADSCFKFFLPLGFNGPTVQKYWGALHSLVFVPSISTRPDRQTSRPDYDSDQERGSDQERDFSQNPHQQLEGVFEGLELISESTDQFRDLFSTASPLDRSKIQLAEEFQRAWLHLIMLLVFSKDDPESYADHLSRCGTLVIRGIVKTVQSITRKSLLERLVFTPTNLAALIGNHLLHDTPNSMDISETYLESLGALETRITANPLDRSHQNRIMLLKQEISVIKDTLQQQGRIFCSTQPSNREASSRTRPSAYTLYPFNREFRPMQSRQKRNNRGDEADYYREFDQQNDFSGQARNGINVSYEDYDPKQTLFGTTRHDVSIMNSPQAPNSQLSPTDPSGFQSLLVQDSLSWTKKRIREFDEIYDRVSDLEILNIHRIDTNKDRQESAIYAFTVVTVVFLPLSTVASILGMNTNDIRNLSLDSWIFWAIAIPLAAVVITLCLIWTGELTRFWRKFVATLAFNAKKSEETDELAKRQFQEKQRSR